METAVSHRFVAAKPVCFRIKRVYRLSLWPLLVETVVSGETMCSGSLKAALAGQLHFQTETKRIIVIDAVLINVCKSR